jgi:hypothetical protein
MSHDHLVLCRECHMPIQDIRDCECIYSPLGWSLCAHCEEEKDYERQEQKRNAVY